MKNEPVIEIRKTADGDAMPSSPSCNAVPTMTAIITMA